MMHRMLKTTRLCLETAQRELDHAVNHPYSDAVYKYPGGDAAAINARRVAAAEARVERLAERLEKLETA